VAALLIYNL